MEQPHPLPYETPPPPAPPSRASRVLRVVAALALMPFIAFCAFGFLASFEPGTPAGWTTGYAVTGFVFLGLAVWLIVKR